MTSELPSTISDNAEGQGRKEYLKNPNRNPSCPTGKEKIQKCAAVCLKSSKTTWIAPMLW